MRAGKGLTLFSLNGDMNNIIKIKRSLEDSSVLIYGVTETVKHELKKQEGGILRIFIGTFSRLNSATNDFFSSKRCKWKLEKQENTWKKIFYFSSIF